MVNLKGKVIKHERNMDVCYQVISQYEGSTHLKLKVRIINMGFEKSYFIFPHTDNIEIAKASLFRWSILLDTGSNICYRNCKTEAIL